MKFDDFVNSLSKAGWVDTHDAQHVGIKELWEKMFPVIAELEQKVFELECIVDP